MFLSHLQFGRAPTTRSLRGLIYDHHDCEQLANRKAAPVGLSALNGKEILQALMGISRDQPPFGLGNTEILSSTETSLNQQLPTRTGPVGTKMMEPLGNPSNSLKYVTPKKKCGGSILSCSWKMVAYNLRCSFLVYVGDDLLFGGQT